MLSIIEKIKFAFRSLSRPTCLTRYIAPDGRKMVVFFEKSSTGVKRVCKFEIKREFDPYSFEPYLEEIEFQASNKEWYEKSTAADCAATVQKVTPSSKDRHCTLYSEAGF